MPWAVCEAAAVCIQSASPGCGEQLAALHTCQVMSGVLSMLVGHQLIEHGPALYDHSVVSWLWFVLLVC
jgi:hypothetical protein